MVSASASKDSCIYYSSFNCNAPCYYVDKCDYEGHPHYVQCDSEYCSNTGIPGLDCRKEPPDENAVCPGSNIKVNQYGMFNSECKKCEWKVVDNRYGGYGLGLTTADSENCSPNPKCGSNNKGSFKAGTFLSSNLCLSGTPFPATLHVSESTHSWTCSQGGKKVS